MRISHYLKHNIRAEHPRQCIFFDTETKEKKLTDFTKQLELKFGMACYTRELNPGKWSKASWFEFDDAPKFWTWVDSKTLAKKKTWLFAHNLVFDLTITKGFTYLLDMGYKLTKAIIDDPPTVLQFRKDNRSICLVDTFNYFRSSLDDLGQSIGLPKLTMPLETDSDESWTAYCQRDVEILKEAMLVYLQFIKDNDLGNFQLTMASQAFTASRHRFMNEKIFIDNNVKALDMARASYHGGRTEAFFVGEKTGDFYLLDVNSMYPFVMSIHDYPTVLKGVFNRVSLDELSEWVKNSSIIAEVTLETKEPCFPVKTKEGLIFPLGKFRAALTTPELAYALAKSYIKRIHRVSVYEAKPLFTQYVYTLYKLRRLYRVQGNIAFEFLCKLMLNSLYGKFGQSGRVYQDEGKASSDEIKSWVEWDADTHQVFKFRQFAGIVQSYKNEGESFNSHPSISSHVCAYARMWLWQLMTQAGHDNVYYVDTDSLVVNKDGYNKLYSLYAGDGLGEIKLVKHFTHMIIHGPKDYQFGDVVKIKGVSKKAVKTGPNSFEQDMFIKFKTMLRDNDLDTMIVKRATKHLKREYHKGWVQHTGRVEPFTIEDDNFDLMLEAFKRKARTEVENQILLHEEGFNLMEWLAAEIEAMEYDLNARTIPYGGGFSPLASSGKAYFPGWLTKELDARWIVFKEYLSFHSSDVQSQP